MPRDRRSIHDLGQSAASVARATGWLVWSGAGVVGLVLNVSSRRGMEAMIRNMAVVAVMAIGLAACSSDAGPKQTGGAVLGGIGGAVAGAQFGQGTGLVAGAG